MASVVKQIEAAIIAAMETAVDGAAKVSGFRQSVAEGLVKTSDGDGRPEVLVAVQPAAADSYASPVIEFEAGVRVILDWSDDPTIAVFDQIAEVVERLLMRWNLNGNIETMSAALSTDNFRAAGFTLRGGTDNIDDGDNPSISTDFYFAVKGVYQETETTQEEA